MTNPSIARQASHFVRNLDSLVRLRNVLGDDQEETIKLLKERGADEYLISLIVPGKVAQTDAAQISEESRRLFERAQAAQEESQRQRRDMRRLIGEVRQTRQEIGAKLQN